MDFIVFPIATNQKQIMKSKCCGGVVNSDNYCDQTSNSSDVKPDIRPGSSESDYSLASTAKVIDNTMDIKGRRGSSPLDGNTDLPPKYRYLIVTYCVSHTHIYPSNLYHTRYTFYFMYKPYT